MLGTKVESVAGPTVLGAAGAAVDTGPDILRADVAAAASGETAEGLLVQSTVGAGEATVEPNGVRAGAVEASAAGPVVELGLEVGAGLDVDSAVDTGTAPAETCWG